MQSKVRLSRLHFLRLLAACWPGAQCARDNHGFACNFAKYSPILTFFSLADSEQLTFLNLVINNPTTREICRLATLHCNLSFMACFADINVSQGGVATYARCG